MKKVLVLLVTMMATMAHAQSTDSKLIPQISVAGEGKVKVTPDQVQVRFGVQNTGKDAAEVKKINDETVDKVLKFIKKFGIPTSDVQTTSVSLYKSYDYEKKKHNFNASQTICILLKNVAKYDELMMGLVDNGINNISDVEFKSSKLEEHKSEARKLAIKDAQKKAQDYAGALNQKVGKAFLVTDNSQAYYPPMYKSIQMDAAAMGGAAGRETLALGEIEVTTNVNVSFILE